MAVESEIAELERRFAAAIVAKDRAELAGLMAPEYRLVGVRSTGASDMPLSQWLAALDDMQFEFLDGETTRVELYGDVALATVDGAWKLQFGPRAIEERFYLTDVWVRRDGSWRIVRRHSSPYPAKS